MERPGDVDRRVGTMLSHYRLVERLGAGGMGVVYRAHDTALHRDVAIKLLPAELTADAPARAALLNEARIASRLNHPHVCTIHEVGEDGGQVYVVMELVAGQPLRGLIPDGGLADETVARYGAQIARALAHAHAGGVVHRDLKTANVVVGPGGQAKLLDFGLSRPVTAETRAAPGPVTSTGVVAGTPQYLAPEVLMGGRAGVASDIWSLGVMLHEMISGSVPFPAAHVGGVVAAILHANPAPLPERVGAGLRSVVVRCLAKDPQQRYQHAAEVAAALEALLPEAAPPAAAIGRTRRAGTSARRQRGAALAAVAILALAAVVGWRLWRGGRGPAPPERTVLVLPLEVRGPMQSADFAGRALAEALAVNLTQARGLRVMPVPAGGDLPAPELLGKTRAALLAGAGWLVAGALSRDGDSLHVTISLIDTRANQVLWGEERSVGGGDLALLASNLAPRIADRLGAAPARRYDYFMYVTGPPEMAVSPEMTEALGSVRRYEMPRSLESTRRLVERFPDEPDARVLRVAALMIDGLAGAPDSPSGRAIRDELQALHRVDPGNPWYDVARALRMRRDEGTPIRILSRVLARGDLTPAARGAVLAMRADVFGNVMGDTSAALADAAQAVQLDPASDLSLATLARWLAARGRYAEAADRVRQALALNPTVANYWHQLGNCMLKQGRWEDYIAALDRAERLTPGQDALLSVQCDGLSCVGRHGEAAAAARRALTLRPERGLYALQLGLCLERLGQWREAVPLLDRAGRPGDPASGAALAAASAVVRLRAGDDSGAQALARRAAGMAPTKSAVYALACYHALRGDRDEALRLLETFAGHGWVEPALAGDPNLAALRPDPRYQRLAASMKGQPIARVFADWAKSR